MVWQQLRRLVDDAIRGFRMTWAIKRQPQSVTTLNDADLLRVSDATDGTEKKCTLVDLANYVVTEGDEQVNTGITAHAGGGQANAVELANGLNVVSTVATAADSVKLTADIDKVQVVNSGAEELAIYPETGGAIDSFGTNGAYYLYPGSAQIFVRTAALTWTRLVRTTRYIDRGSLTAWDFDETDMPVQDGSYNDIDLSAILPAAAAGMPVNCRLLINDAISNALTLRQNGTTSTINTAAVATGSLAANITQDGVVSCDSSRLIEYRIVNALGASPDAASFAIRGWWVEG